MHHPSNISKVPLLNINIYIGLATNENEQSPQIKTKCINQNNVKFYHIQQTLRRRAAKKSSVSNTLLLCRFEICKLLKRGTCAKVYPARNVKTNQSVAIKFTDKEKILKLYFVMEYVGGGESFNKVAKGRLRDKYKPIGILRNRNACLRN